jgi:hypothetical protein
VPGLLLATAWWVPLATALVVSLVAATVSYAVTWRFKRADVERENAFRVADLIAEADRLARATLPTTLDDPQQAHEVERRVDELELRVREASVRARSLDDPDLDDRVRALEWYVIALGATVRSWPTETSAVWHWAVLRL